MLYGVIINQKIMRYSLEHLQINLSNSTTSSADSMIDAGGNNVYVSWWERANYQTATREPVMRASNDNGKTFGEMIMPSSNATTVSGGS